MEALLAEAKGFTFSRFEYGAESGLKPKPAGLANSRLTLKAWQYIGTPQRGHQEICRSHLKQWKNIKCVWLRSGHQHRAARKSPLGSAPGKVPPLLLGTYRVKLGNAKALTVLGNIVGGPIMINNTALDVPWKPLNVIGT